MALIAVINALFRVFEVEVNRRPRNRPVTSGALGNDLINYEAGWSIRARGGGVDFSPYIAVRGAK